MEYRGSLAVFDFSGNNNIASMHRNYRLVTKTNSFNTGKNVHEKFAKKCIPSTGTLPVKWRITSMLMPESVVGWPGPGDMTTWEGLKAAHSANEIWSLRATCTYAPSYRTVSI